MTVGHAAEEEGSRTGAALGTFVAIHYDRLIRLARLVCRDTGDAADAVQVGLQQAWVGRATLRDDARMSPWLDRIVMREAIRISKRRQSWFGRLIAPAADVPEIDPMDRPPEAATLVALRTAFLQLSPEQRAVVALHLHAGYTVAETAVIVGAPEDTVRSRLRLARQRLRRELEESRP